MTESQTILEWAVGVGAALGALIMTIFGGRKLRQQQQQNSGPKYATLYDLEKLRNELLEADRLSRHEIYNRLQVSAANGGLEDNKIEQRMEQLFKSVYAKMDEVLEKLAELREVVAVIKDRQERQARQRS